MGQLIIQDFVSADGFAADANNEFTFYEYLDGGTAEFDRSQLEWLKTVDTMVLGANTYREFAEYWPTPASKDEIIAPSLNGLRRVVFSRHLAKAPWGDMAEAAVESGDAIEAIRRIKGETDGDIVVWGSLTLAETFLAAGVVNSVRLVVMPIAIGAGRSVFPSGQDPDVLNLQSAKVYDQGLVELVYGMRAMNE
ncbi:dihydrofolate reductase family protein [Arthrobacter sp. Cr_A7]|uniref:dihydrofolate reductase family protein n=1 Tax=Arthrobacter sp. Cr_A7 TaxID=3031017 RepID=UPI0023DBDD12|nr:dihydrofolate reductase family protein [Arthrobacter sp. Cr_A7]MDF2050817.1 dihydrofolate reductase family protein [Arthrobacter sp. Cr_A7]